MIDKDGVCIVIEAGASIGDVYKFIMENGQAEQIRVAKPSPALGELSFFSLDQVTKNQIAPVLGEMNETLRGKRNFMLDVAMLNLLKKSGSDQRRRMVVDVHLETLMKTALRARYFVILADFLKNNEGRLLINVKAVPVKITAVRLSDQLRYLMSLTRDYCVQVRPDYILKQDITAISSKYITLSVADLSRINHSSQRDAYLARLSRLPAHGKEIIVRDEMLPVQRAEQLVKNAPLIPAAADKPPAIEETPDAFYL